VVKNRRFDTKRAAAEWERRQRAAFDEHGCDPRLGRVAVEDLIGDWLEQREGRVSPTTLATDRFLLPTPGQRACVSRAEPVLPAWFRRRHVAKVTSAAVVQAVAETSPGYADLVQVLARAGLRWGEARAMLVHNLAKEPIPRLLVTRNQPEGVPEARAPKSGKTRTVPLPDSLLPAINRFAHGKSPDDLLFTSPGGARLHRSRFVQSVNWAKTGRGRTLHDLRHMAACEWILQGVPLTTVQAWLGHSSIEVTARYLHHLGDFADRAALNVLNGSQAAPKPRQQTALRAGNLPPASAFGTAPAPGRQPGNGLAL
jgi:integrase